ncbi:MAG: L-threonylcarbamoyladenylate synthase, partial [Lachnospiraceae bacterium]|nr:L-threonylcarbamoyladenylate synthase [Lachnospiraceae bacterium]
KVPFTTTGGLSSVAVRIPSHPVAAAMIHAAGVPIAAPSANISGRPSPTLAKHVVEDMDGRIEMILDGGNIAIGIESTIVDMTSNPPVILRPGYITKAMLEEVIGEVGLDPTLLVKPTEDMRPKAPGMKYRHYAPKAELTLYEGSVDKVARVIWEQALDKLTKNKRVAIIATKESQVIYDKLAAEKTTKDNEPEFILLGSRQDEESIARNLYAVLRECDERAVDYIYSETFSLENFGQAIMNRLRKAAGYNIINLND